MIYLLFGAIGFLAAGFTGIAIGVIVAFVIEFIVNWVR
tara:strand:- start:831 stop:944 length:114 start_codon:yes stop_codon:yes gene_type:complete